jgi:hypothetical protein
MKRVAEEGTTMRHLEPVKLSELLRQVPGKWVAIRGDEIIEARDTFDAVVFALTQRGIDDATIMRSPAEFEAEMVGLG